MKRFGLTIFICGTLGLATGCTGEDLGESFVNDAPPSASIDSAPGPSPTPSPTPVAAISSTLSSITSLGPSVVSDGISTGTVTVTLVREDSSPAVGEIPTFTATDTGATNIYGACTPSNASGVSTCSMTSTRAEVKTLSLLSPVALTGGSIAFIAGAADSAHSSIVATGPVKADGTQTSTVTITLKDAHQNPLIGTLPLFAATDTGSRNSYGTCTATNSSGVSTCAFTSSYAETKTVSVSSPIALSGNAVEFTSGGLNLVVPIEMVDTGVRSETASSVIYERSRTSIDKDAYDGLTLAEVEMVITNANVSNSYNVEFIDSSSTVLVTFSVPASTQGKIYRSAFTLPSGVSNYRIKMPQTAANDNVLVHAARIYLTQQGATKTKLYFPLGGGYANGGPGSYLEGATASADFEQDNPLNHSFFRRNDSAYSTLAAIDPFELDVVVGNQAGVSTTHYALFNREQNAMVAGTEVTTSTNVQSRKTALIALNAANFNDLETYEIRAKGPSTGAYVYKAGIWMKLENLTKAEIHFRAYRARSQASGTSIHYGFQSRFPIDLSNYSNPQAFFEVIGAGSVGSGVTVSLDNTATVDSGTTGGTIVPGSSLVLSTPLGTKSRTRTSNLFSSIVDGQFYLPRIAYSASAYEIYQSTLAITVDQ